MILKIYDDFGQEQEAVLTNTEDSPYLEYEYKVQIKKYNSKYGDDRICVCGHPYYRHFDSYENMMACGCKYCGCIDFIEETNECESVDARE